MPKSCHYLGVRLRIERQRFANFGLEAGTLFEDKDICAALQLDRPLLLAVLAEIKGLLEDYATKKGRYDSGSQDYVNQIDPKEPEDLVDLLCLPPEPSQSMTEHTAKERFRFLRHARGLGDKVMQTGRDLRTIVVEPKRLIWVAVDQESFQCIISKLEHLNSFLIAILDKSQARRLQAAMDETLLELLQIRNGIKSLENLVKALHSAAHDPQYLGAGVIAADSSLLSRAVARETKAQESKKDYLRQLAEVKIQHTRITKLADEVSISPESGAFIGTLLDFDEFSFAKQDSTNERVQATYQGRTVLVEWKQIPYGGSSVARKHSEYRIGLLAGLLCREMLIGFRALPCLGYIRETDDDYEIRLGIVFDKPTSEDVVSGPLTLQDVYEQRSKPSLSARISMCAVLARSVHSFHAVDWLHKGLQSDNIIFFPSAVDGQSLGQPFVSGFEMSRPSSADEMTEKPTFDPFAEIYRHPRAQSSQTDGNYQKSYDIYSLGIILIEIAFWKSIDKIVGIEDLVESKPSALSEVQLWLLGKPLRRPGALPPIPKQSYLQQVAPECGDVFSDVVELCLTASDVEELRYPDDSRSSVASRPQHLVAQDIAKRLEDVADALQKHT
jgi:hypothetical protein